MNFDLERGSILPTLAYFDMFDYPLTEQELERFLYTDYTDFKIDYTDFVRALDENGSLRGVAERSRGFYFLPGREEIIERRKQGRRLFEEKIKIAQKAMRKILWVPFVRAVFVCNTSTGVGIKEGSDIDVFVIVRQGRLWLSRILVTFVLGLFRFRRTRAKIKNKICLSFYVTDNRLNLLDIALKEDVYLMYWLALLIPIYDPDNLGKSLWAANQWATKHLPNAFKGEMNKEWQVGDGRIAKKIKNTFEKWWGGKYGDLMEKQAREAQKIRMKMNTSSIQNLPDTRVVVNDEMLKFHEGDRREEYRDRWMRKCQSFNQTSP